MRNPYGDMSQAPRPVQPQWGQPSSQNPAPQQPPPNQWGPQQPVSTQLAVPGYVSYGEGTAPPYQPYPYEGGSALMQPNELGELEDQAQLWLMLTVAGFWVGFGWLSGPLAWYRAGKIRRKYRALGHHPCAAANWAWGLGIASTSLYGLIVAIVFALLLFVAGLSVPAFMGC